MSKSKQLFSRLTEIQSEAAESILRILRKNSEMKKEVISTDKETYVVSIGKPGGGSYLEIDDGMDVMNEYKIDVCSLVEILNALEERFRID